ncbi:MAG TPA: SDR family oxidoreductase [Myxococcaceae bacterium]|nr:SDR family oxidoreductase [Myxococcaceae bacterium]
MAHEQSFVVTGSASGIGKYITRGLVKAGHRVLATDINLEGLRTVAQAGGWASERVRLRALDVRDVDAWNATFEEAVSAFGGVDVLMNIAGYMRTGHAVEMPPEEIHRHFDINVKGVIFGTQTAARHMIARRHGHIVNISSMSALAPIPGIAVYSASKHAVRAFSIAMAYELRETGVDISVVLPDAVETPMTDKVRGDDAAAVVFSGNLLTVEEIGDLILGRVLAQRPLELAHPPSRGWLARIANLFPHLSFSMSPMMERRGMKHLEQLRREKR